MEVMKYTAESQFETGADVYHFHINSIKYAAPIHTHEFYEIFLITQGDVHHIVNGSRQYLTEGALVFIRPEDVHYYEVQGHEDCRFINICYKTEAVMEAFRFLSKEYRAERLLMPDLPPMSILTISEKDSLVNRLRKVNALLAKDITRLNLHLKSVLVDLLVQYFSDFNTHIGNNVPLWLESLLLQMQKKENFIKGLPCMIELADRSPGHLDRVFRQYMQTTPTAYINHLRLQYAKSLILTTNISILDIAMEAGFGNLSHFYHLFKAAFKMAPLELRKKRDSF